ncbi:MAG: hypothetical protein K2N71_09915 [Oscillospiraceae bacterium]|nr:hypothetical protein [Oscillospiraceae bacterium]
MKSIKVILAGIVLILASLFFMGICIINHNGGFYPDGLSLGLFIFGIIICVIGLFFVRNNEYNYDEEDDDDEDDNDEE